MQEPKGVYDFQLRNYGHIRVKVKELLEERGITRYRLSELTGVKFTVIDRYYKDVQIAKVDLDILSRICYVLACRIEDVLEYEGTDQ